MMKYFIDTHDKTKGSFPVEELTEQQFFDQFDALEKAAVQFQVVGHAAYVNLEDGKAFCFMSGPDEESIRKAHAAINLPNRVFGKHSVAFRHLPSHSTWPSPSRKENVNAEFSDTKYRPRLCGRNRSMRVACRTSRSSSGRLVSVALAAACQ
jgi:Protein of unknown function (DUF4242)